MNKADTTKILSLYSAAYPAAELSGEQVALWVEMMRDLPFETGLRNMREHIRTSKFAPTIAEIIGIEPHRKKFDAEIYQRNKQIAHQQWVDAGGDPHAFKYDPSEDRFLLNGEEDD